MFVGSQSFISLPCFVFVSAVISEISESNQNKEKKSFENGSFNTVPSHVIDPFLTDHIYSLNLLEV